MQGSLLLANDCIDTVLANEIFVLCSLHRHVWQGYWKLCHVAFAWTEPLILHSFLVLMWWHVVSVEQGVTDAHYAEHQFSIHSTSFCLLNYKIVIICCSSMNIPVSLWSSLRTVMMIISMKNFRTTHLSHTNSIGSAEMVWDSVMDRY